jgi:Heparinase II/III-like protein
VVRHLETGLQFRGRYLGFEGNRVEHRRELFLLPGPCWVFMDTVQARRGSAPRVVTSRIHCHPQAEVVTTSKDVQIRRGSASLRLLPVGVEALTLEKGWFSPTLGVKEPSPVLSLRVQGRVPLRLGFVIASGDLAFHIIESTSGPDGWQLQLMCRGQKFQVSGA